MGTLGAQALEERDARTETEVFEVWQAAEGADVVARHECATVLGVRPDTGCGVLLQHPPDERDPLPELPAPEPVDEPPAPTPGQAPSGAYQPTGDAEGAICEAFGEYCADALAVAVCESGPDYWAGVGVHAGTFQLSVAYHAGKFAAHGWDIWADGSDIYANSVVAYEIFAGRGYTWLGTSGWPVCGWRAGY